MKLPTWLYADHSVQDLSGREAFLSNEDLKPVEPARRLWGPWNFVAFWLADSININTWMIISGMIIGGLTWWEAWLCTWIGYTFSAVFICLSGRIGATYHISFPIVSRSSFGLFGSLWPVFNRSFMACVWYGVQAWLGGKCIVLIFRCICLSYETLPNTLPASFGTNTRDFIGFIVFWALSLIAIWFPVQKIRILFTVKSVVVPIAALIFFIWSLVKAKGLGPVIHQPGTLTGSAHGWAWMSGIMSCVSNFVTLIVNNPDYTRFATRPSAVILPQLLTIPIGFSVTCFIGIIVGSSSKVIFGEPIWNPLDLLGKFLDSEPTGGTRAGVFFIALAFALAQLGVNIAANSVSAGSDLTAILPKFLNIRRSGYICAVVGLIICPWNLLSNSSTFTTYLSAYSTFLSSVLGVMITDYYIVRKGYLKVKDLYSGSKEDAYYFTHGINWRAYVAYIVGILINIFGFADAVGIYSLIAARNMYHLNFYLGFIVSSLLYYGLCKLSPIPACGTEWPSEVIDNDEKDDNIIVLKVVPLDKEDQSTYVNIQDQETLEKVCRL
ncbi:unnamed protein product [Adineta steineri]|uniref:Uracil permease n=1 Tax=Adineta steineri TaxID=433720 RepID=A0A818XAE7_9BILA|nr:unnamed protein product [Adineta steineri]CAF1105179.1 unnamed protein product [Adineta steineri]CAF3737666.1 unnamed protein product [Adineta steineri]CAF3793724.1 unnamed protein product [Adineta steineri]